MTIHRSERYPRWRRGLATCLTPLALCLPGRPVDAQSPGAHSPGPAAGPWLVGVGVEGFQPLVNAGDGVRLQAGAAAQIGYERLVRSSRFGVRLGASYVHRPDDGGYSQEAFGFGLTGTYALAAGRVRPYLLAGVGADDTEGEMRAASSAGFGALFRVGRSWLFTEARAVVYPHFGGSRSPAPRGLLPVTVGLRF